MRTGGLVGDEMKLGHLGDGVSNVIVISVFGDIFISDVGDRNVGDEVGLNWVEKFVVVV